MGFEFKGKFVFFATNNFHKFDEARRVLAEYKIAAGMLRVKALEIQSDSISDIAQSSVIDAFGRCGLPIIVEDAGLFVDVLNGFPGPYSAYVYKTIENVGLLKLMADVADRRAVFKSVIAYYDGQGAPVCFEGEAAGAMTLAERVGDSKAGFGFDPIFQPAECVKTFAEMAVGEKNGFSHRARAVRKFAEWYKNAKV